MASRASCMRAVGCVLVFAAAFAGCASSQSGSLDQPPAGVDKISEMQVSARRLGEDVCGAAGWKKVADEYGGNDEASAAEAYGASMQPAAQAAATEGCLTGFGY